MTCRTCRHWDTTASVDPHDASRACQRIGKLELDPKIQVVTPFDGAAIDATDEAPTLYTLPLFGCTCYEGHR